MGWELKDCDDSSGYICEGIPPTSAPTTAVPSASPTITPVPSASPAPTTECLVDEFEGTSLGSRWTDDAGGDRNYVVADGAITFSGTSHVRSVRSFATPLIIRATLDKGSCSNHYIKLSTEPWDQGGSARYEPGVVTFMWNEFAHNRIYGQTDESETYCARERIYEIEIIVDGSTVTFRDAAGACEELVVYFCKNLKRLLFFLEIFHLFLAFLIVKCVNEFCK